MDITTAVRDRWFLDVAKSPVGRDRIRALLLMAYRLGVVDGVGLNCPVEGTWADIRPSAESKTLLETLSGAVNTPPLR